MKALYPSIEDKRDLKECTFAPEINQNSYKLVSNQDDRDTFEHLYSQAKTNTQMRDERWKERQEELTAQSLENCTFKPNLEPPQKVDIDIQIPVHDEKLEERAMKYAAEKRKRIEENEKAKADRIDEECTFRPKMVPRKILDENIEKHINLESIDKYIDRMNQAKEHKLKTEKMWEDKIGSGKHWKGKMTIPEAPKLVGRQKQGK